MEKPIEQFNHDGLTVKIYQDSDAQSPDEWEDDVVSMVTTRNCYFERLCEIWTTGKHGHGEDCHEVMARGKEVKDNYHVLPLWMYAHSGVALRVGDRGGYPFDCQWDAGQVGFVLVKKREGIRNVLKAAQCHVETWNQYLSGDVYGVVVEDPSGEQLESCWGFYGLDYAIGEGRSMAEGCKRQEDRVTAMERGMYAI